jgi:hypothetical protein
LVVAFLVQAGGEFPFLAHTGLAQMLRQSAWQHALAGLPEHEPMPWVSGTAPAAAEVSLLGLSASVVKIDPDTAAVTPIVDGKRSAPHNKFGEVGVGDKITVTTADGASRDYRVTGRRVVDPHLAETSPGPSDVDATLVTCMPLDPLLNSLSLVIQATKVEPPAKTVPAPDPEQKL